MSEGTVPSPRPPSDPNSSLATDSASGLSHSLSLSIPRTSVSKTARSNSVHARRTSIPVSPVQSPRAVPVPVPPRQGSIPYHAQSQTHGIRSPSTEYAPLARSVNRGHARGSSSIGTGSLGGSMFLPSPGKSSVPASAGYFGTAQSSVTESVQLRGADKWLSASADQALRGVESEVKVVKGDTGMEAAVDILLRSGLQCLVVEKSSDPPTYGFFDYADLNTFLLLVLQVASTASQSSQNKATSTESADPFEYAIEDDGEGQSHGMDRLVKRLKRGERVQVREVCDVSQKDPFYAFPSETQLRTLLPVFASGVHRVAVTDHNSTPRVLDDACLLGYLSALQPDQIPNTLNLTLSEVSFGLPLHPLVSLPSTASVLDAMQVMSLEGLSALGVLSGPGSSSSRHRRTSSTSSGSSSGGLVAKSASQTALTASPLLLPNASPVVETNPFEGGAAMNDLVSVVTARECATLVVPSEGKRVLGMGLGEMSKCVQVVEEGGRDRGEERVPVQTITQHTTLLHASLLILATSSSRVFLRPSFSISPPLSPVPSLSTSTTSPPASPSISSLSLSDTYLSPATPRTGLPAPPPVQLSPHYVVSIVDILSCLARAWHDRLTPPPARRESGVVDSVAEDAGTGGGEWDLDPAGMGKRRRASSLAGSDGSATAGVGAFESWRWGWAAR
ncbi:hypothetical protein BCR39DRAFT_365497 [Naematelia encephala]|uniref:CBS domain-containing protein n=1 Tax=Naematelia encephala TaxID=71784 RepID=A0A1Y2AKM1_9TREE|nr:hypothetical protein BCR39DRAFT_365497 [Naematelia encephala]